MTTLREAALMALGALEYIDSPLHVREIDKVGKAIAALDAALEQPEHTEQPLEMVATCKECLPVEREPVAWMRLIDASQEARLNSVINAYGEAEDIGLKKSEFGETPTVPLYTAPPKRRWQGLTHEERDEICKDFVGDDDRVSAYRSFALEVEVRLTEKNK
jgi:hypothetical protein